MPESTWYLLDEGAATPAMNMAVDEMLLATWDRPEPLLRLYAWDPPGLSLGYFQRFTDFGAAKVVEALGAEFTRRITGGDAILHIHELTFSVTGGDGASPFQEDVESSYRRIHEAMALGFRDLGVESRMRALGPDDAALAARAAGRCFYAVTRYDLVAGSAKLVGSAQRRTGGRVLHHGSLPLAPNPMTPESADLTTLAGRAIDYGEAARAVRAGFEAYFDAEFRPFTPDEDFRAEARKLATAKYGAEHWVKRR